MADVSNYGVQQVSALSLAGSVADGDRLVIVQAGQASPLLVTVSTLIGAGRIVAGLGYTPADAASTVTSVAASGSGGIVVTGSPITTAGTLSIGLTTTGITPGTYSNATVGVDAYGRVTAVSAGGASLPLGFAIAGKPAAGQLVHLPMAIQIMVPGNLAGTVVYCGTPPTADAVFTFNRISGGASTLLGTVTFQAGSHTAATLSPQAGVSLGVGDVVQLVAPATADATLADIGITLLTAKV